MPVIGEPIGCLDLLSLLRVLPIDHAWRRAPLLGREQAPRQFILVWDARVGRIGESGMATPISTLHQ